MSLKFTKAERKPRHISEPEPKHPTLPEGGDRFLWDKVPVLPMPSEAPLPPLVKAYVDILRDGGKKTP